MQLTYIAIPLAGLCLPGLVYANCNVQSCGGALAAADAGAGIAVGTGLVNTIAGASGCAAATLLSFILPELLPVDIICWGLVGAADAAVIGGPIALAGLAGGCDNCSAAKPCNQTDPVAMEHGCGTNDPAGLTLGPKKCAQLTSSILPKDRNNANDVSAGHPTGPHGVPGPDYTFHCQNKGLITDSTKATCYWDCSWCSQQCAGK